jgi:anti-anti-sigma factor
MQEINKEKGHAVVRPYQDITAGMLDELRQGLKQCLAEGVREIVLDLKRVDMIDSQGLGLIIATYNSLTKVSGALRVQNLSPDLMGLFRTMRLDQHFPVALRPE